MSDSNGSQKSQTFGAKPLHYTLEFMCAFDGARTRGPNIKSVVLYQLSYERIIEESFPDLSPTNLPRLYLHLIFVSFLISFRKRRSLASNQD